LGRPWQLRRGTTQFRPSITKGFSLKKGPIQSGTKGGTQGTIAQKGIRGRDKSGLWGTLEGYGESVRRPPWNCTGRRGKRHARKAAPGKSFRRRARANKLQNPELYRELPDIPRGGSPKSGGEVPTKWLPKLRSSEWSSEVAVQDRRIVVFFEKKGERI